MKKSETTCKGKLKNTPRNKIRYIKKALKGLEAAASESSKGMREYLLKRLEFWKQQTK